MACYRHDQKIGAQTHGVRLLSGDRKEDDE